MNDFIILLSAENISPIKRGFSRPTGPLNCYL